MKLRIKETGELLEDVKFIDTTLHKITIQYLDDGVLRECTIKNLSDIEEVKDYEEPKEYWYIDWTPEIGVYHTRDVGSDADKRQKEIGNYFETKEEAEKAVEKLKAWKRLKDKGFEFCCDIKYENLCGNGFNISLNAIMPPEAYADIEVSKDLDLLFGGEE